MKVKEVMHKPPGRGLETVTITMAAHLEYPLVGLTWDQAAM